MSNPGSVSQSKSWAALFARLVDADLTTQRGQALLRDRVDLMYRQGFTGVAVHTIVVGMLAFVLWPAVDHAHLVAWAVVMVLLGWARGLLIALYLRAKNPSPNPSKWGALFILMITLVGVTWGYGGVAIVPPGQHFEQVMFILLLGGTAAGTVATLSSFRPAIVIALTTSVIPLIARLFVEGGTEQVFMAVGLVMYFMAMMATARSTSASVSEALALRFENVGLLEDLRHERAELEISNRAKTRFLAAASHDLRQPLHALNLTVAAYRLRTHHPDMVPLFDRVERSVQAMEGLVNSLLDISRLDAGIVEAKPAYIELQALFAEVIQEAEGATSSGLGRISFNGGGLGVITDPTLLETILRNLVGNALSHAPGADVWLAATLAEDDIVVISVEDNGPGIAEDLHASVFEEFFQAGSASADKGGLGLGLAIVKRLAVLLGSDVKLVPVEGGGARFEVRFARAHASRTSMKTTETGKSEAELLSGLNVVLLEDDPDVRGAMKDLLLAWGCAVTDGVTLDDLQEGAWQPGNVDVVLTDLQLGHGVTGPDQVTRLRDEAHNAQMPAIVLTGNAMPEQLKELQADGFTVLHKPVDPRQLAAAIALVAGR